MNRRHAPNSPSTQKRGWKTYLAALTAVCVASLSPAPHTNAAKPPPVPVGLEIPDGFKLFRVDHAVGTQNFFCVGTESENGPVYAWVAFGPQATLSQRDRQTLTHFLSANPQEAGALRPAWHHSRDSSTVWAKAVAESSDPAYVAPGAIPWLKLEIVGRQRGPTGGGKIIPTRWMQRLNTTGGLKPTTGCSQPEHIGARKLVPYTADYYFYRSATREF